MIILDTNVVAETMKPEPDPIVLGWFDLHDRSTLFITAITQMEILIGVALLPHGKRKRALEESAEGLFRVEFEDRILPFDSEAARRCAHLLASRRAAGRPISQSDAQIAAIAQANSASLATRNVRDFTHCGLEILNPWNAHRQ